MIVKYFSQKRLKLIIAGTGIMLAYSVLPVFAIDSATLSEIQINPREDSYEVTVKTDRDVSIDKQITSDNELILNLKGTKPAKFVNTIYNNTSGIDHVIIQSESGDQVKVLIEGENVAGSSVKLSTEKTVTQNVQAESTPISLTGNLPAENQASEQNTVAQKAENPQETIILQHPISSFKPVTDEEEAADESEAPQDKIESLIGTAKTIFNTTNLDWMLRFLMLALVIFGGIKLLGSSGRKIKINLAESQDLTKDFTQKHSLSNISEGMKSGGIPPRRALGSASNYGLREYQNSQNPYLNMLNINPSTSRIKTDSAYPGSRLNENYTRRPESQRIQPQKGVKPQSSTKINQNEINKAKINVDNKKFLETMAKIYEKSGRPDLAQGIQRNIKRTV